MKAFASFVFAGCHIGNVVWARNWGNIFTSRSPSNHSSVSSHLLRDLYATHRTGSLQDRLRQKCIDDNRTRFGLFCWASYTASEPFPTNFPIPIAWSTNTERFFRLRSSDGHRANGRFVWIPPGTFVMEARRLTRSHGPRRSAGLWWTLTDGFWISRHEVTQREFGSLMGFTRAALCR
jgi:formylglycine-generating enzyme required for sulfatase activity